ncbi:MAG: signal peptidase I [Candidatus Pacearchaeota archaeon]|jgi:signal peptidase I
MKERGENWKKFKKFWKRFWFIVWKDNSFKGWIISLIFLFIIIKFVFFPLLELSTGTDLPLVIVESCSMYHSGNIFSNTENWWQNHETKYNSVFITKNEFLDFPLKKGFDKGDVLFAVGKKPEKLKVGDVIIFEAGYRNPIIHRIISIKETPEGLVFSTMGDNNNGQLSIEKEITEEQIIGKASVKLIPYIGWMKLIFYEHQKLSYEKGFCEEN